MKRAVFTLVMAMGCIASIMIGAGIRQVPSTEIAKPHCVGYTVIEAGKGVDCYGDTVKLIKRHGFYELAARYNELADSEQQLN